MVTGGFKDGTETVFGRRCGGIRKKRGTLISRHIIQRMLQRNPAKRSAQRGMLHTSRQAQGAINVWLRQHNQIRPHHASGMTPPAPETLLEKTKLNGRI